ncbi:DEAD/DEAH box helicase [Microbacterium sp. P05]|uniref:DEAD/DEAH box helicase n=1 Tax=Microbacterium sp. P05 TaxID=3366948 RepID=UPI00374520D7
MPKNKKPAGGRPAKNFEPRYGDKPAYQDRKRRPDEAGSSWSASKPGSKSPSHRGHRPAEATDAAPKRRWTAQERAGRDASRGIRTHSAGAARHEERPARSYDDRPARSFDRPARSFDERPARSNDRPARSYDERPARSNDRPTRSSDDRPARSFDRPVRSNDDRPARSFDRPARSNDRPVRSNDRPVRSYDERPRRDDRPARSNDERPARSFDRPARSFDDRPDRPNDRPAPTFAERQARLKDRPARSARSFDPRPRRASDERPARSDERPTRSFDRRERPAREERPGRSDWSKPARTTQQENRVDTVHERLQAEAVDATSVGEASFADLGLGQNIVQVLTELGAPSPFPIQAATVAPILEGRDVLARGRTGSGKTIAFGAPLVESVLRAGAGQKRAFARKPRALILAPTRELALQIDRTVQPIARSVGLFTTQIYGGVPQGRQVGALRKGVDIIIGTPGRIEDLIEQGKLDLSEVTIAVLDEADHMCELGFLEPVQRILRHTAEGSQKLLFSATLDREVAALVDEFLVEPAVYEVAGEDQDSGTIEHRVLVIDHRDKAAILTSLVDRDGKTLVFARTRAYAEMLAEQFDDAGISAVALHGDLNQAKRTRNLERLTSGRVQVLVATDVAARGIHVDDIDLVVQADPPDEYKTYMHRSGRTGRAGRAGRVVSLITRQRQRRMTELLDRAEIDAPFEDARPGDDLLEELSGRQASNVAG